jgi:hypothetical protein
LHTQLQLPILACLPFQVWTVPLAQMGISWLQGRVPLIDFDQLSRRSALPRARLLMEDGQRPTAFRYPDGCRGVGEMWRRFGDRFGKEFFRLGHRVISIDPKEKSIKTVRESSHNKEDEGCPKNGQTGEVIGWNGIGTKCPFFRKLCHFTMIGSFPQCP